MVLFSLLPTALIALLWVSPVFSTPTSPNDPFRAIAIHALKPPDPPVCCLIPLPPLEPVEDDVLLSFEDWKAKQSAIQAQAKAKEKDALSRPNTQMHGGAVGGDGVGNGSEAPQVASDVPVLSRSTSQDVRENDRDELISPHFRVPLTDRFNYASLDCSARVHTAHRSAKSPSSILSSKRDRYMLSPCTSSKKEEKQYVVVELCDDIRIDTVQLANFEFFSGVFKDFAVSVAKTYTTDMEGWTVAGVYKAKNVRGVQSFHPPTSLRDFYRYIRIDLHSHYGNEYYCPVSLLRVYGLTHLEQWKWDIWEAESRAKRDELEQALSLPTGVEGEHPIAIEVPATKVAVKTGAEWVLEEPVPSPNTIENESTSVMDSQAESTTNIVFTSTDTSLHVDGEHTTSSPTLFNAVDIGKSATVALTSGASSATPDNILHVTDDVPKHTSELNDHSETSRTTFDSPQPIPSISDTNVPEETEVHASVSVTAIAQSISPVKDSTESHTHSLKLLARPEDVMADPPAHGDNSFSRTSSSSATSTPTAAIPTATLTTTPSPPLSVLPPPPLPTGGESIYRTIMNRLTALEANHTLYARYVEEQTAGVREVLRRLAEDVGRLEGIGKAQAQVYQRTLSEWERQGNRLDMEYGELMSRVNYLADEVVLETRLVIAELCLLLAVLIFMGVTRGSRGEALMGHGSSSTKFNDSVRNWSRRNLSFSSDWMNRLKSSTQNTPYKRRPAPLNHNDLGADLKVEFPSQTAPILEPLKPSRIPNTSIGDRRFAAHQQAASRSRTPVSRHLNLQHHLTPLGPRLPLQRASSQGGGNPTEFESSFGLAPKSAKKWARSAHLHEVRRAKGSGGQPRREEDSAGRGRLGWENEIMDLFSKPNIPHSLQNGPSLEGINTVNLDTEKQPEGKQRYAAAVFTENTGEGDGWVDTDVSADGSEVEFELGGESNG